MASVFINGLLTVSAGARPTNARNIAPCSRSYGNDPKLIQDHIMNRVCLLPALPNWVVPRSAILSRRRSPRIPLLRPRGGFRHACCNFRASRHLNDRKAGESQSARRFSVGAFSKPQNPSFLKAACLRRAISRSPWAACDTICSASSIAEIEFWKEKRGSDKTSSRMSRNNETT